jgi:hypothetical protein
MNKEQVYDTAIAPLMTQIIETCQKHGIAMVASFAIPTPDDEGLACTSVLPDQDGRPHALAQHAMGLVRASSGFAIAITTMKKEPQE